MSAADAYAGFNPHLPAAPLNDRWVEISPKTRALAAQATDEIAALRALQSATTPAGHARAKAALARLRLLIPRLDRELGL